MQKEPKLVRARKIPEWEVYDAEISRFSTKLAELGLIHSRFAAADTNVLAGQATGSSTGDLPVEHVSVSSAGERDEL